MLLAQNQHVEKAGFTRVPGHFMLGICVRGQVMVETQLKRSVSHRFAVAQLTDACGLLMVVEAANLCWESQSRPSG